MKYQVIVRHDDTIEIHSRTCREISWTNYYSDGLVDAGNAFGAAVETTKGDELDALKALQFPCLAPDYAAPADLPRRGKRPTQRAVPFDLDDSDDAILEACYGKVIKWTPLQTDEEQVATMYPAGPYEKNVGGRYVTTFPHHQTKLTEGKAGRRVLNFIDMAGTGFRAAYLDRIVSVK